MPSQEARAKELRLLGDNDPQDQDSRNDSVDDDEAAPDSGHRGPWRILYLDHTAALSGGEIALLNLVRHIDRKRFTPIVVLFSYGPLVEKLRESGVETRILKLADRVINTRKDSLGFHTLLQVNDGMRVAVFTFRLARMVAKLRVDLIHANSLKADIIGGIAGRLAGVKVIWHIRDRIAQDYLPARVARLFQRLCRILPHFVLANSYSTLSTLGGINPGRAAVVTSGSTITSRKRRYQVVHDGMSPVGGAHIRPDTGKDEPRILIGLVGRISRWKGQHIFIRAAAQVIQKFPHARFQIVGSAMFSENLFEIEIRQLTRSLGLDDVVEFTGFREDVSDLIAAMDILVHASTTGEPFGQVVIEGMAAGKPVVATNGGGIPEIVKDGKTGILVPMGDVQAMANAICHILAAPAQGREMGRLGRERVLKYFTIQQTAARVEKIYLRVLPSRLRK